MSKFLNGMVDATNFTLTENGGVTHKTTKSDLLDMFAMGAAMRKRSNEDVILMWRKAYAENPVYAFTEESTFLIEVSVSFALSFPCELYCFNKRCSVPLGGATIYLLPK